MNAVDTNILIYVHDPRDRRKQEIASSLIVSLFDGVLLWQVACEYIAASRKLGPFGYKWEQAWDDLRKLQMIWPTALPTLVVIDKAEILMKRNHLSFWDAMVVAACLSIGVKRLYSEDFDAYTIIEDMELVNPFKNH